ncbi:MAG: hypothetical protein ACOCYT_00645 [Chloroflexota bacterium]
MVHFYNLDKDSRGGGAGASSMGASSGLRYEHRADGIHAFHFESEDREIVDMFIGKLESIYTGADPKAHIHLFIDTTPMRVGPPIRYIARKLQPFFETFPDRPAGSLAIITSRGSFFTIFNNLLAMLSRSRDRFHLFQDGQQDDAVRWLLNVR